MTEQIERWEATVKRYELRPARRQDGTRRNCARMARAYEQKRDIALARYHHYEVGSAAFQIGIVLASATVITGDGGAGSIGGRARPSSGLASWGIGLLRAARAALM